MALERTALPAEVIENGTGDAYVHDLGNTAYKTRTGGATIVSDTTYGDYPSNIYTPMSVTTALAEVLVLTGLHGMQRGHFQLSGLTAETVAVAALSDGGVAMGGPLVRQVNHATPGTKLNPTALGNGIYEFEYPLSVAGLTFTKSAAVETATLTGILIGA